MERTLSTSFGPIIREVRVLGVIVRALGIIVDLNIDCVIASTYHRVFSALSGQL